MKSSFSSQSLRAVALSLGLLSFAASQASAVSIVQYNFVEDTTFETSFFGVNVASPGAVGVLNLDAATSTILGGSYLTVFNFFGNLEKFDLTTGGTSVSVKPTLGPIVTGSPTSPDHSSVFVDQNFISGPDAQIYEFGEGSLGFGNWVPNSVSVPETSSTLALAVISLGVLCLIGRRLNRATAD